MRERLTAGRKIYVATLLAAVAYANRTEQTTRKNTVGGEP